MRLTLVIVDIIISIILCIYAVGIIKFVANTKNNLYKKILKLTIGIIIVFCSNLYWYARRNIDNFYKEGTNDYTEIKIYGNDNEIIQEYSGENIEIIDTIDGKLKFKIDDTVYTCYDCKVVVSQQEVIKGE